MSRLALLFTLIGLLSCSDLKPDQQITECNYPTPQYARIENAAKIQVDVKVCILSDPVQTLDLAIPDAAFEPIYLRHVSQRRISPDGICPISIADIGPMGEPIVLADPIRGMRFCGTADNRYNVIISAGSDCPKGTTAQSVYGDCLTTVK